MFVSSAMAGWLRDVSMSLAGSQKHKSRLDSRSRNFFKGSLSDKPIKTDKLISRDAGGSFHKKFQNMAGQVQLGEAPAGGTFESLPR